MKKQEPDWRQPISVVPDSCVLLATISNSKYLGYFRELIQDQEMELLVPLYVLHELHKYVQWGEKFGHRQAAFYSFIDTFPYVLLPLSGNDPLVASLACVSDPKDQPILSAAIRHCADVLLTHDRHFLNNLAGIDALDYPLLVCTPGEFTDRLNLGTVLNDTAMHISSN